MRRSIPLLLGLLLTTPAAAASGDCAGPSPDLHAATAGGCLAQMERLIARGEPLEARNETGDTALLLAAKRGRTEAALLLLGAGADPSRADRRQITPLAVAVYKGDERLVGALLAAGVTADQWREVCQGRRGLIDYAARQGQAGIIAKLLAAGLDANVRSAQDWTPLMRVAAHGSEVPPVRALATMELLLARGAQVDLANHQGRTALMLAAQRDRVEIVALLLAHGADPTRLDFQEENAMDLTQDGRVLDLLGHAAQERAPVIDF
ncbi:MAG: ankyrin repeat domain-containing protein [Pseudomonadota bacterium]